LQSLFHHQGWWMGDDAPRTGDQAIKQAISRINRPVYLVNMNGQIAVSDTGSVFIGDKEPPSDCLSYPLYAYIQPLLPQFMGDPAFKAAHGLKYAYVAGAMANGITSVKMVEEMGKAGMIGFFGSAGLLPQDVEAAIDSLSSRMGGLAFGFNLIHSPNDPELENTIAALYLKRGVNRVCASAYLDLTLPLAYFRVKGIYRDNDGKIIIPNKIIGKISRREVARKFLSPPPEKFLAQLLSQKMITEQEAELARLVPMADAISAEADSGGHTDNRPAIALLPTIIALRDEFAAKYRYDRPICVGLGGGIATPESAAAAFAMGAAYILTGSINQACVEAGTSEAVRTMLAEAQQADVTMAPAADMFEMGVKVQVLRRGTMFPQRAAKLYEFYSRHDRYEDIAEKHRAMIERDILKRSFEQEWEQTKKFFTQRDPRQVVRAEKDAKHKMALVFRSYLGQSSRWATRGEPSRKMDYQIWCGPALGAFNEWAKGSFLEKPENRDVVTLAMNLLFGSCVVTRANWLRCQLAAHGIALPSNAGKFLPTTLSDMKKTEEDNDDNSH